MSWQRWADELRNAPERAVTDLLRGVAEIEPYGRVTPHEFLLAILPRNSRSISQPLLGEPHLDVEGTDDTTDLPACLDTGLAAWLITQRQAPLPPARKLGAYAAQVCEALQWPLYFKLPQTDGALRAERALWLPWLSSLTLSAYRDPEYDYWQVLAARQTDDQLQVFWQSFVVGAGRLRSLRYLNLGLLALARLPLSDEDSLHNLRLQVQTLINRYQLRKVWGAPAQEELANALRGVMARNPSLSKEHYRAFLSELLSPLGEDKRASVLSLVGISYTTSTPSTLYKLKPPGLADETSTAVRTVRQSSTLGQAWKAIHPLLSAHEDYLHKSGDAYYFVRTLDCCARALCEKYPLREPEVQSRIFQWINLALRMDADDPRRWMLWELALRKAGHPQRAQWVLWEMTRRFPDHSPCRVELARLLATFTNPNDQIQADHLLEEALQLDPNNLHAYSTLAQLAIRREDWHQALGHAQKGLQIDPSNEHCAVLLATAYALRNEIDDLKTAIGNLKSFVMRNSGSIRAEGYLRELQQRELPVVQQQLTFEDDETPFGTDISQPETDAAWRTFADSVRIWVATAATETSTSTVTDDSLPLDRVLPLPQALRQAVARLQWDSDVLERYDIAAQQEFPLEMRLWRYLRSLQSTTSSVNEHHRAKEAVEAWLDIEARSSSPDNPSWLPYLNKHWETLNISMDTALTVGAEWLKDLLDRYQPLPAPLFA
ncbi:MAG TPA: hypothetical protein VFW68_06890 [Rhodocyclaceae bacterium]|nr:hypothetical protein [Rhodocyclaceae bacterium]